jgi:hypothetical protein
MESLLPKLIMMLFAKTLFGMMIFYSADPMSIV